METKTPKKIKRVTKHISTDEVEDFDATPENSFVAMTPEGIKRIINNTGLEDNEELDLGEGLRAKVIKDEEKTEQPERGDIWP